MSGKGSFENQYPDYDQNTTQTLLKSKDAISEAFQKKLNNFKTSKLQYLTTNLQKEIFHDGTVYTGSAGLSLYYLMTAIGNPDMCNDYLQVTSAILASGKQFSAQTKSQSPLLWQWHDKVYLGAAHGMAGILYMLLQAAEYIKSNELRLFVKPSIDWLLSLRFSSGNFPSSLGSSSGDRLVQWCHGAPGLVPLCITAYKIFKEEKYLKTALQCGEVVWERGLCTKGYSICHGVSGNTYAFLQLYQITKKPVHLYRACCFMEWCALERPGSQLHQPDRPASLFEGLLGRIYLAEDINKPMDALFPAFCL
ncbi:lanC-like protein 2 isoform X4 [Leptidea sinapis]|uniref:lanC-like protein 2 isoform X4 n=1 Tax=Leptidea sinapis TaxID=189913 RepID=UPI0021C36922|nr:lanC-like protein 2 isoform X4 [Leptidea sinapis]